MKSYWHMVGQSLVKFLAGILCVIQQELAWCELIPVDGFKLPHLLHQLVRTEGVHETERSWKR